MSFMCEFWGEGGDRVNVPFVVEAAVRESSLFCNRVLLNGTSSELTIYRVRAVDERGIRVYKPSIGLRKTQGVMDPSKYKKSVVRRGYTYRYYCHPPALGKPTLLFVHGFPSTSYDWRCQVTFFEPKGFGLIVPDCLGYAGTSKPTDFREFRWKLLADDLVDIMDEEDTGSVIGIGHDWRIILFILLSIC